MNPSLATLTSFKQYRIEKVCFLATNGLYRHEIHYPFFAFEFEIQTITNESVWPVRQRFGGVWLMCCGAHSVCISFRNGIPGEMKTPLFLDNGMPLQEDAAEKLNGNAFAFSPSLFLPNTPSAFADRTLSSPLAETIYTPSATGRFRVLCCHTRESWQKNTELI